MVKKKVVKKKTNSKKLSSNSNEKRYSVMAIVAFLFSLVFFLPIFPIIGFILGVAALTRISKNKNLNGKGMAIAAIIIGAFFSLIQIGIFISLFIFLNGITGVIEKSPADGVKVCLEKNPQFVKESCLIFLVTYNYNNTLQFDPNLCDENVETPDIQNLCNAVLKHDKDYCNKIEESQARLDCFGLIEEIERKSV